MKIAILTSSRADYSIYYPLLKKLHFHSEFDPRIIAFGTHLSNFYGKTINAIIEDGFEIDETPECMIIGDTPESISTSLGTTINKFSQIWKNNKYNLIIGLGDRYEMYGALAASIPFNIPIAHIHGGETTIGAIDNIFRHSITLMAKYHFASTENHKNKIVNLLGSEKNIYNVGALALDNIDNIKLLTKAEFQNKFKIDLDIPTVLMTFHPETVSIDKNEHYVKELCDVLKILNLQVLITMPNADTYGTIYRDNFKKLSENNDHIKISESLGLKGYYSCMKYCKFIMGNSSSGIIEAASFSKYVINIGDRQKGRDYGKNVIHCPVQSEEILKTIKSLENLPPLDGSNIYGSGNTSEKIIKILSSINE